MTLYPAATPHKCDPPYHLSGVEPGSVYKCDECGKCYKADDDWYLFGLTWRRIGKRRAERLIRRMKK